MNSLNSIHSIILVIILSVLLGCRTDSTSSVETPSTDVINNACVWIAVPIGFKMTTGLNKPLIESAIAGSENLDGINTRCSDLNSLTPIQALSAMLNDAELPLILLLLQQGADVNLAVPADSPAGKNYIGATALHIAAEGGQKAAILQFLIEFGGDVTARTNDGATPLHFAGAKGDSDMVEVLLEHGSDIEARDQHGWTALHHAARHSKHETVVIALVDLGGADIEATTNSGLTAHDLILDNETLNNSETAILLEVR